MFVHDNLDEQITSDCFMSNKYVHFTDSGKKLRKRGWVWKWLLQANSDDDDEGIWTLTYWQHFESQHVSNPNRSKHNTHKHVRTQSSELGISSNLYHSLELDFSVVLQNSLSTWSLICVISVSHLQSFMSSGVFKFIFLSRSWVWH